MKQIAIILVISAFVMVPTVSAVSDIWSNLETNISEAFNQ